MQFAVELWAGRSLSIEVEGNVASIDGAVIPTEMLEHAIRFGFRQLIRDAGAISAEAAAKPDADAVRNALAEKKVKALIDGTLREGAGGGPKLTPVEREMRAIAEAKVRAAAMSQGLQLPAKKILDLAKKLYARDEAKIRAEAEANLASRAESVDFDLSDLETDAA